MYTLYKFHFLNGISEINQLFDDILIIWPAPVLFQRSYNWIITETPNDTGQTNKYSKKRIKSTDLVFATKLRFIMYGKHLVYSLSLSRSRSTLSLPHRL